MRALALLLILAGCSGDRFMPVAAPACLFLCFVNIHSEQNDIPHPTKETINAR